MQKVFETYAQRKGVQSSSLRFLLDGERIEPDSTPKMLELDDPLGKSIFDFSELDSFMKLFYP